MTVEAFFGENRPYIAVVIDSSLFGRHDEAGEQRQQHRADPIQPGLLLEWTSKQFDPPQHNVTQLERL